MRFNIVLVFIIIIITVFISVIFNTKTVTKILEKKKINNIIITNNQFLSDDYLLSNISVKEGQSFWLFNPFRLKKELGNLNELEDFEYNLDWKGNLKISINERFPFMKWITENGEKLIDSEGKILNYKNKINNLETINLYGKAANINIKTLKEDFLEKNFTELKVKEIFFFQNIGWKIKFYNKKCVFFPLKQLEKTYDLFEDIMNSELYSEFNLFDMRIKNRVYMSKKC